MARLIASVTLLLAASVSAVSAETLMMPNRDARKDVAVVVWGISTMPHGTTFTLDYGDGTSISGTLYTSVVAGWTDRSYIAFPHTYSTAGMYTARLTTGTGATAETATVEVRVFDPASLPGGAAGEANRGLGINMAIQDGLRYLWFSQANRASNLTAATTNWGNSYPYADAALIVLAFENHDFRLSNDASMPTGLYEKYIVRRGLNYLFSQLALVTLSAQAAGTPCVGSGTGWSGADCKGLAPPGDRGYSTAVAMLPIAASGALDRKSTEVAATNPTLNKTYGEILQRLVNAEAFGQTDQTQPPNVPNPGRRGGFGYHFNGGTWDGSTIGWAILGFLDAATAGATIPSFVKTEFAFGFAGAHNNAGSFDYQGDNNADAQGNVGIEKAGIALQALHWLGQPLGTKGNATLTYISDRWNSARLGADSIPWGSFCRITVTTGVYTYNKGCAYAMFNNFKGLRLMGITTLPGVNRPAGPGYPANDWYADYQDWLVTNQTNPTTISGGHWASMIFSCCYQAGPIDAAMAELILSNVALVLPDPDEFARVGLTPPTETAVELNSHTVTAHAVTTGGNPVPGANVVFTILTGPNAGLTGSDTTDSNGEATFTYTDAGPEGTTGTDEIRAAIGSILSNVVQMVWTPINTPPVAVDDSVGTTEDTPLVGNVAGNDSDVDTDDVLTWILVSGPSHGTLEFNSNGSFSYTPDGNYFGPDGFTYKINDGLEDSNAATVTIDVTAVNDPPFAQPDSKVTPEDTPLLDQVLPPAIDPDGGAPTYALAGGPMSGASVVVNPDGSYTYTPAPNYSGPDSFTYTAFDGLAFSNAATISITVTPLNDPPVGVNDELVIDEDGSGGGNVLTNDTDVDTDHLFLTVAAPLIVTAPLHGDATLSLDGEFTYIPAPDYHGSDSFTYRVTDGALESEVTTVAITVRPLNDPPVAGADFADTNEDTTVSGNVLPNDSDIDNDPLTTTLVSGVSHGLLEFAADGSYTYTPEPNYYGSDSFTYTATDGSQVSNVATVTITIASVNDSPVCSAVVPSVNSIWPPNHRLVTISFSGATDVDGGALTYVVTGIFQDEPTNTQGDGNAAIDGFGVGTSQASVRAERVGTPEVPGDGRVYHIRFRATDGGGASCPGEVLVGVPHDQSPERINPVDGGALYDSTVANPPVSGRRR